MKKNRAKSININHFFNIYIRKSYILIAQKRLPIRVW